MREVACGLLYDGDKLFPEIVLLQKGGLRNEKDRGDHQAVSAG
jgi:hypothetical protein